MNLRRRYSVSLPARHNPLWLVLLFCGFAPGRLSAEPAPTAVLALEINEEGHGDIFPRLQGEDVLVPKEVLSQAGIKVSELGGREVVIEGMTYLSLRSVSPQLTYAVDEKSATLRLTVQPRLLKLTRLDLAPPSRTAVPVGEPSAFLNYAAQLYDGQLLGQLEAAARLDRALISSTVAWVPGHGVVRGLSQVTLDDPQHLFRVVAGERFAGSGNLGGSAMLAGLHVSRSFEMNPFLIRTPSVGYGGTVATPSTVDVYVNNVLVRHEALPPGPFELSNIPMLTGENSTRYVLKDGFGRQQEVLGSGYLSTTLLARGLTAFDVSVGLERSKLGEESFHYGMPAMVGFLRTGLTDALTAGARLEVTPTLASGGSEVNLRLPLGEATLAASLSVENGTPGAAALAAYKYQGHVLSAQGFLRAMTPAYATVSQPSSVDRPLFELGGGTSVALTSQFSVSGTLSASVWRDKGMSSQFGIGGGLRISEVMSMAFSASRRQTPETGTQYDALITFSLQLGHTTTTAWARATTSGPSGGVELSHSVSEETGFGYHLRGQEGTSTALDAEVEYRGPFGHYAAAASWFQNRLLTHIDASGSLVAIGGHVRPTRVVDQGFALVQIPGVAGAHVLFENREVGQTDGNGLLIVPGLLPYYNNRISLRTEDIPEGYDVPYLDKSVSVYPKSGASVVLAARLMQAVRGTLTLAGPSGDGLLTYGALSLQANGVMFESPIGSGGEFELIDLPPGQYEAEVIHSKGRCRAMIEVPSTQQGLTSLGKISCKPQ